MANKLQTIQFHPSTSALSRWLRKTARVRAGATHRYERRKVREALRQRDSAINEALGEE
jgi:hypothetical protein